MAGARHGMCELMARHKRGTACSRHAMCESGLRKPDATNKILNFIEEVAQFHNNEESVAK
jgi:hypothetical protein